jgi:hypothetical protein
MDLKRTNTVNSVLTSIGAQKGTTWENTDQLFPLPATDIKNNPSLVQNPGY